MNAFFMQAIFSVFLGAFLGVLAVIFGVAKGDRMRAQRIKAKWFSWLIKKDEIPPNQRKKSTLKFGQAVLDVIYFLLCGVSATIFAYATCDGQLRLFSICFGILSAILAIKLFCVPWSIFVDLCTFILIKTTALLYKVVIKPIAKVLQKCIRICIWPCQKIYLHIAKIYDKIRYRRYQLKRVEQLKRRENIMKKDIISWQKS